MSKRSRQRTRPRPQLPAPQTGPQQRSSDRAPIEPERLLLDQIAAGVLDEHLTAISEAVPRAMNYCIRSALTKRSRR